MANILNVYKNNVATVKNTLQHVIMQTIGLVR